MQKKDLVIARSRDRRVRVLQRTSSGGLLSEIPGSAEQYSRDGREVMAFDKNGRYASSYAVRLGGDYENRWASWLEHNVVLGGFSEVSPEESDQLGIERDGAHEIETDLENFGLTYEAAKDELQERCKRDEIESVFEYYGMYHVVLADEGADVRPGYDEDTGIYIANRESVRDATQLARMLQDELAWLAMGPMQEARQVHCQGSVSVMDYRKRLLWAGIAKSEMIRRRLLESRCAGIAEAVLEDGHVSFTPDCD